MIKWNRTSRLSIKKSLSEKGGGVPDLAGSELGVLLLLLDLLHLFGGAWESGNCLTRVGVMRRQPPGGARIGQAGRERGILLLLLDLFHLFSSGAPPQYSAFELHFYLS